MESLRENSLAPLTEMIQRVRLARLNSESALLDDLLTLSEMVLKLATLGMMAGLKSERRDDLYALTYSLVRADSLGTYSQCLNELINGETRRGLDSTAASIQSELNKRGGTESSHWPEESLLHLFEAREYLKMDPITDRRKGIQWFELLPQLRNRVKHGSPTLSQKAKVVDPLERSLFSVIDGFSLFSLPWFFQYPKVNGELVTLPLNLCASQLDEVATEESGVHLVFDEQRRVPLLASDPDLKNFWFPNGNYRSGRYERISYRDDAIETATTDAYERPPVSLPASETQGLGSLEVKGEVFTNLPSLPRGYVDRSGLEHDLKQLLLDPMRHPITTLHGSGGLGKTSLALAVLHEITALDNYDAILWFSSRDVDLLPERPTQVARHLATAKEISTEATKLLEPDGAQEKDFDALAYFSELLENGLDGAPLLFVFDNFETVEHPSELFRWISTHIRLPNKALITTRHRQFKADYPLEVAGLERDEFEALVSRVIAQLDLDENQVGDREELYNETDGSPYIAKVILGQLSLPGNLTRRPRLLIKKRSDVLESLFAESFAQLSEDGQRVFLILGQCIEVPLIALESVLSRSSAPAVDVEGGLEPLVNLSLVSVDDSAGADDIYVGVQVTAARFSQRKLKVSPLRALVEGDVELLRMFGDRSKRTGVAEQFERFKRAAVQKVRRVADAREPREVLSAAAMSQPELWLLLADYLEEIGNRGGDAEGKIDALRLYLEHRPEDGEAWKRLAECFHAQGDRPQEEVQSLVERAALPNTPIEDVAKAASRFLSENKRAREAAEEPKVEWMSNSARGWTLRKILGVLERRSSEAGARECSTAAWLCISDGDPRAAREWVDRGLALEPDNEFLLDLDSRLSGSGRSTAQGQTKHKARVPMSSLVSVGARRRILSQGGAEDADRVCSSVIELLEDMREHPRLGPRLRTDGVTLADFGNALYSAVPDFQPKRLGFKNLHALVESATEGSPFSVIIVNSHPRVICEGGP